MIHQYLFDLELPEGIELLAVSDKEDDNFQLESQRIFISEENGYRIYINIADSKKSLTINEFGHIVSSIKKILTKEYSLEGKMRDWFRKQWEGNPKEIDIEPEWILRIKDWEQGWIPITLIKQSPGLWRESFIELIYSYFDVDFFEVIISSSVMIVVVSNKNLQLSKEQTNELDEFALGLYEMIQNEWTEEIKIGIHFPIRQLKGLIENGNDLLQDVKWITFVWKQVKLFSPWSYHLERLVFNLPNKDRIKFISNQWEPDKDTCRTLEVFFEENLNMSETARKLYIHRNTLQYRLDKVKQSIGFDVKTLEGATMAKIMLLLKKTLPFEHSVQNDNKSLLGLPIENPIKKKLEYL